MSEEDLINEYCKLIAHVIFIEKNGGETKWQQHNL